MPRSTLVLAAFLALAASPALAADFDGPYGPPRYGADGYGPDRPPPPRFEPEARRPHFVGGPPEACRTFVRRRLDPYGEPVLRRVRVCDEPAFDLEPIREDGPPRFRHDPRW